MTAHALIFTVSPQARASYLALASIGRRAFSTSPAQSSGHYFRSDFSGQGFTGIYEPGQPTAGPLSGASAVGAPRITPRALKQHLDQFVVGQERAKKKLSEKIYHHYLRIEELQRQQDEQAEREEQARRREMGHRHAVEDEYAGQQQTVRVYPPPPPPSSSSSPLETSPIQDLSPLQIEKSNILLVGPSGVGKTLMVKTLARALDVPFSMSDCTPFTQAGYIGEDAEVCVQRLFAAANYDPAATERGIICLDELDKIATAKVAHGKDVGGEGVQQALLKIIEGTTLQLQAKPERGGSGRSPGSGPGNAGGFPSSNPLDGPRERGSSTGPASGPPGGKGETFNIRTDNILFICAGAFVGLHKIIMDRVSKGSIGFGAPVRSSNPESGSHETMLKGEEALYRKHLPYFIAPEPDLRPDPFAPQPAKKIQQDYNVLDLVEPKDLQKYGLIPELVGRIPDSCALSALDEDALVRVLTEPRNSLVAQNAELFQLSGIELRFTSAALREIAKTASSMGTGARGLRTVLERLLGDVRYEAPGSPTKYILITQDVAQLKCAPLCWHRGQSHNFHAAIAQEEDKWEEELRRREDPSSVSNFQEYRKQGLVAGAGSQ
ncbi:P-loop containing nucleoside triphosphate hydrolase protein [Lophiotrema nucula]|uniref:P-loop containing nucleoside triphosphate hydrolase protein n=1 Tax=Lophiotrema nucula TaxID=690887 RepID=A0A6A5ZJ52_9PLEO|nr:P-loop containing nucleoside triphosphate hydrolase protein [Lophiotrema nucula]